MSAHRVLIADDEAPQRSTLAGYLKKRGFEVLEAGDGVAALNTLGREAIDLLLTDLRMPGLDGLELLKKARELNPLVEVIVMTAFGTIESAVEAMQAGAHTYIQKPVSLAELQIQVDRALERKQLHEENRELRARMGDDASGDLIATSQEMREVFGLVARAAPSRASVLILGESGTGKEMVARAIHTTSPRAEKPFVPVNIAAIPETLVESELFGHEKGSFTGAVGKHTGVFERASGGTLFIDEVGDMPLSAQVKLLRVLQEGTIERVGGSGSTAVDVRIVAATNADLEERVRSGEFREDLFYRLNVVRIELPPLRARKADIPLLVEHFIKKYASLNGKEVEGVDRAAMDLLMKHHWPGNVRELENAIESAVVLSRGSLVGPRDLSQHLRGGLSSASGNSPWQDESLPLPERVDAFERDVVQRVLDEVGGNQSEAARRLGMSEKAIRYRLSRWNGGEEEA
ncbi:sigma-54 dependent transcriptional regulator [bacterium]|nr:sigma-54 dependent transcriptional regulator [bacterium]